MKSKTILITGGTGTWGQEITRQLLDMEDSINIIVFSRNESAQVLMKNKFKSKKIKFILGDIRDSKAINEACKGVNIVFHTAALKHVAKCEIQPREAIHTNICGTMNVIDACIDNDIDICVNISSDKACYPTCTYGNTKSIAESLITEANNRTLNTDFFSVRSGNIFGSSGSVIPLWEEHIKKNNCISVTHPFMNRFFITIQDAVFLTFKAMDISDRGEIFVFKMPSYDLGMLSHVMIQRRGNKSTKVEEIGPLPGERMFEYLFTQSESCRFVDSGLFFVIHPSIDIISSEYPKSDNNPIYNEGFLSTNNKGSINSLKKMFIASGY